MEEQYPVDFEVANHYTARYPDSFLSEKADSLKKLMVRLPGPAVQSTLLDRRLIARRSEGSSEVVVAHDEAVLETLAERFGLRVPAGTADACSERRDDHLQGLIKSAAG
jgi:N-hydroxyarylamine O-acetyltransferase